MYFFEEMEYCWVKSMVVTVDLLFWDYHFLILRQIFLCQIITLAPLLLSSTLPHFSVSLLNAECIVSAFPSVVSTSVMKDIFF